MIITETGDRGVHSLPRNEKRTCRRRPLGTEASIKKACPLKGRHIRAGYICLPCAVKFFYMEA